jgi:hypothetical protein
LTFGHSRILGCIDSIGAELEWVNETEGTIVYPMKIKRSVFVTMWALESESANLSEKTQTLLEEIRESNKRKKEILTWVDLMKRRVKSDVEMRFVTTEEERKEFQELLDDFIEEGTTEELEERFQNLTESAKDIVFKFEQGLKRPWLMERLRQVIAESRKRIELKKGDLAELNKTLSIAEALLAKSQSQAPTELPVVTNNDLEAVEKNVKEAISAYDSKQTFHIDSNLEHNWKELLRRIGGLGADVKIKFGPEDTEDEPPPNPDDGPPQEYEWVQYESDEEEQSEGL